MFARRQRDQLPYSVEYVQDQEYVSAVLTGDLTESDLQAARDEINVQLCANDSKRLLVDATGLARMQSVFSDFEFTAQHRTKLPPGTRHAVFVRPEHREHMQFVEDVGQNRMVDIRIFLDRDEALGWLLDDQETAT